jgi:hypothetical protein
MQLAHLRSYVPGLLYQSDRFSLGSVVQERSAGEERANKAMSIEQQFGAVFADRVKAETAVEDLRRLGLADEHLGIAVYESDSYVFEEDADADVARGIEKGIVIGAPIGAVAGMTILALVIPGVGILGVGGILAAGGDQRSVGRNLSGRLPWTRRRGTRAG